MAFTSAFSEGELQLMSHCFFTRIKSDHGTGRQGELLAKHDTSHTPERAGCQGSPSTRTTEDITGQVLTAWPRDADIPDNKD